MTMTMTMISEIAKAVSIEVSQLRYIISRGFEVVSAHMSFVIFFLMPKVEALLFRWLFHSEVFLSVFHLTCLLLFSPCSLTHLVIFHPPLQYGGQQIRR